jgi:cephalosporin-C deacetylase-like acetyl esterase
MLRESIVLTLAVLAIMHSSAPVQQPSAKPTPGDLMMDKYLAEETKILSQRFLDGAKTLAEWQARRPRLKQEYLDMLGLLPLPEKTPLHATITGTLERDQVVIEKLHYQSRPGLYVTANLYRPKEITSKLPGVLYVCGHSGRGRDGNKTAFQDHGMWFATNGYVCLVIDTLQLGEIPGIHHGTFRYGRWWWQALGYTPAGVECWNGIRGIDYLVSRPEVDPERIAVTGISGGGAYTIYIAAADDRVKCAVPVSGMSDLESYITNKVINGHCDCMFLVNTYRWEWTTIAALIAPRPMLFCNSDNDPIFPMDGNRRIIERLRQAYKMYGKPDLVDDYVSHGGHDYRPDLRMAIFKWINKHIKNETGAVKDADFTPIPGKELRVFPGDSDVPKDAMNAKIDETFLQCAHNRLPKSGELKAWKNALVSDINRRLSHDAARQAARVVEVSENRERDAGIYVLTNDPGITFSLCFTRELTAVPKTDSKHITVKNPREQIDGSDQHVIFPRGCGLPWTSKSPPNYVERAHALLGRTVDEGRVIDIVSAIRFLNGNDNDTRWAIRGQGQAGVLAAYAALLETSISEVEIVEPTVSHRDGPIFLNILRVVDIPEALGSLAPRKLTLVNARDKAFDRTAEIYKLAGAQDKFLRK